MIEFKILKTETEQQVKRMPDYIPIKERTKELNACCLNKAMEQKTITEYSIVSDSFADKKFGSFNVEADANKFLSFLNNLTIKIWRGGMYAPGCTHSEYKFVELLDDTNVEFFSSIDNIMTWVITCSNTPDDNIATTIELIRENMVLTGLIKDNATGLPDPTL